MFGSPPVRGLGNAGGFKIMIENQGNAELQELQDRTDDIIRPASDTKQTGLIGLEDHVSRQLAAVVRRYRPHDVQNDERGPERRVRDAASRIGRTVRERFQPVWTELAGERPGRRPLPNAARRHAATASAQRPRQMVPLGAVATVSDSTGPFVINRYNLFPAAAINGMAVPGMSSGDVIAKVQDIVNQNLPPSLGFEWTDLMYLQIIAGNTTLFVFAGAVVLVFLVLAGQYESWSLPLAVIFVVPMCILCSVIGVAIARMDINIFTQIGFVVLVGLASKNAILIVEFAKSKRESGMPRHEATLAACRLRLRPIMMTSFAFILGVLPLVLSSGAGAEMRRTLGVAVFSGMLGVTLFGIFLTPVFFNIIQWFTDRRQRKPVIGDTN